MSEIEGEKDILETYQSQGDNFLVHQKSKQESKLNMIGHNFQSEVGVSSTIKYNEDDDNTMNQFGQSQVKFRADQYVSPVKRIKGENNNNKQSKVKQNFMDYKKTISIVDKVKQYDLRNSDSLYQESHDSIQNSGMMNYLYTSQRDQNKPEQGNKSPSSYKSNFKTKVSKFVTKKSQKNSQNFMIFINTRKAFRKFKSFITPSQIDHTAFRYIKDLASYDKNQQFNQINNLSVFSQKQRIFLNEMQKQTNKFFNLVRGVVVQKNNCRNKLLKCLDHHLQIIDPMSKWKISFDILLILATIISSFCKTVEVFFDIEFNLIYPIVYPTLQTIIVVLFILDILFNFNTGVYKKGAISYNRQDIYRQYRSGRFLLDTISLISFVQINEKFPVFSNLIKLLILLKAPLVSQKLEIAQQIAHSNQKMTRFYYVIQLLRLILTIFAVAHFVAICFFGQIILSEYLKTDNENNWLNGCGLVSINDDWFKKYIFSLYFSVTTMMTVGYGDITPVNIHEAIIAIISMVIACGVFAYSFNLIGSIISEMNKRDELFKSQVKKVHIYLQDRNIDQDLKYQVLKYLEYKQDQLQTHIQRIIFFQFQRNHNFSNKYIRYKHDHTLSKEEEDTVLSGLSTSLLSKIEFQAKQGVLNKAHNIFQIFSKEIRDQLCLKLKEIRTNKEEIIFEQDTISENPEMYFIHRGHIEIYFKNKNQSKESIFNDLKDGEYFGEMSFLTNKPRISSARTKEASVIFSLSKQDFLSVLENNKQQLEKYHVIHQKLVFGESNSIISSKCYFCKKENHSKF